MATSTANYDWLKSKTSAWIDVRSAGEFAAGGIAGFRCLPILSDSEREQVGRCYKLQGQVAAIALGEQLVAPTRSERIERWREEAARFPKTVARVSCWRGGLRSRTACLWLREAGAECEPVEGGYKALRRHLLSQFAELPDFCVAAGLTGSGKTELLRHLCGLSQIEFIDLEALACHRGSSFGALTAEGGPEQPSQASFENALALGLWRLERRELVWLEDESRNIGRCALPSSIYQAKMSAPAIWLEANVAERTERLFAEYVARPLRLGLSAAHLHAHLERCLSSLNRRLGGLTCSRALAALGSAFASKERDELSAHWPWLELLLTQYYDPQYLYSWQKNPRAVIFRGTYEECSAWLTKPQ